jgi:SAM-dependent methyltransferase
MPCASYADPRLAAVYDPLNPHEREYAFFAGLAGERPLTILDVGCGTGALACLLSSVGHEVTGADPAGTMLDIARRRPGGESVEWVQADAARLSLDARFDLVLMTGHVFQVLLGDDDIAAALGNLRRHLAPGGRIAFETRNAEVREWEEWTPELTRERVDVPGIGTVAVHYDIRAVEGPLVTFETHFDFGGGDVVVASHTLRFMIESELAGFLADASLKAVSWYGDYDGSPLGARSPELIVITRLAAEE